MIVTIVKLLVAVSTITFSVDLVPFLNDIAVEQRNRHELPEFINEIRINNSDYGYNNKSIQLEINQEPFWVTHETPYQSILINGIEVFIDGESISEFQFIILLTTTIYDVVNDSGETVGWYPNPFTLEIDTSNFAVGTHHAKVLLNTLSDRTFTYSWYFNMNES